MSVTKALVLAVLLAIGARPARAQWTVSNHALPHTVLGVGADIFVRGPWIASSFKRHTWQRVAMSCVIGAAAEGVQYDDWGSRYPVRYMVYDTGMTCAGAVATEGVIALAKKLLR